MFQELADDIGFNAEEAALLRQCRPFCEPHFPAMVDRFYAVITASEAMRSVFSGPDQIERQKSHLKAWLGNLLEGTYDEAYFEQRARIGRAHVRIRLDQRYMFSMMNVLRVDLQQALREGADAAGWDDDKRRQAVDSLHKLIDLELAIMLETYREDYSRRLSATERLAALGQLAASIGHELRNPLAVIDTSLHLLKRRTPEDPRVQKHLQKIGRQVAMSGQIIADLLDLARDSEPQKEQTDIETLVAETLEVTQLKGTPVKQDIEAGTVWADRSQLRQVLANLLQNASQAVRGHGGSEILLRTRCEDGDFLLTVEDDGPGLPKDVLARLFEPLFTTRAKGIGLGLSLCKRIVEKHGGSIEAQNRTGGGARFVVRIPGPELVEPCAS